MKKLFVERSMILMAIGALLFFSVGAILTTAVPPLVDPNLYTTDKDVHEYTEQEIHGQEIYLREGCVYCHTQQIRAARTYDPNRYGWKLVDAPPSESWEYTNDRWHFLGTKRTGPDLARIGGKYADEWHYAHFKDPRNMGEKFPDRKGLYSIASVMPKFDYLSDEELHALTAYLQTLGRNIDWRQDYTDPNNPVPLNDYED